eukprot:GHUV01031540.1.p1 GENE.GHUV01031540.1~~GHUV01031540.1.p1  ORF type:complete len:115 (-),score=6.28 GHUV01031540.1:507-851(-)
MLPFQGHIIAGTTDSACDVIDRPVAHAEEVKFILDAISDFLCIKVKIMKKKSTVCLHFCETESVIYLERCLTPSGRPSSQQTAAYPVCLIRLQEHCTLLLPCSCRPNESVAGTA